MKILGYPDRFSVAPGETVRFMVSCDGINTYRADIVRLIHGDTNPAGPGYKDEEIATPVSGTYRGRFQPVHAGSSIVVPRGAALDQLKSFSVAAMIWPTTPAKGRQGLITHWHAPSQKGWGLVIDEGGTLAFVLGDGRQTTTVTGGPPPPARGKGGGGAPHQPGRQGAPRL